MYRTKFSERLAAMPEQELLKTARQYMAAGKVAMSVPARLDMISAELRKRGLDISDYQSSSAGRIADALRYGSPTMVCSAVNPEDVDYRQLADMAARCAGLPADSLNGLKSSEIIAKCGLEGCRIELCRVSGDSMTGANISDGAVLFVDKSRMPEDGNIAVVKIEKRLFVKRIQIRNGTITLISENTKYKPVIVTPDMDIKITGTVMGVFINLF